MLEEVCLALNYIALARFVLSYGISDRNAVPVTSFFDSGGSAASILACLKKVFSALPSVVFVSPIRLLPVPVAASPQSKPNDRNEFNDFVAYLCELGKKVALHLLLFAFNKLSEAFQKSNELGKRSL
jgi:hypothetical protein